MKNNEEKLYLDNDGYQRLLEEIDLLKAKLAKNGKEKGEAYSGAVGDGWHDNFAFDEANMQERMILGQLKECYQKLERAVIVERHDDETLVDVNDIVTVNMIFGPDDSEELEFKLEHCQVMDGASKETVSVGSNVTLNYIDDDEEEEYSIVGSMEADPFANKISNESPIGKAILGHRAGEIVNVVTPTGSYDVKIVKIA